MERNTKNLWQRNCKPILGTITGRLAPRLGLGVPPKWTVEQALGFIEEQAYLPEEIARIAKANVR